MSFLFSSGIVDAIPDSEVYLHDDWGDNKLTNRDGSGTTTYNGVEGVYRPEWTTQTGSPSAENGQLVITDGDLIHTNINLDLSETITWTWTNVQAAGSDSSNFLRMHCFAEQTANDDGNGRLEDSYLVAVNDTTDGGLQVMNGSATQIIAFDDNPVGSDITVTRSPSGEWELFVGSTSQGTTTEATHTDPQAIAFGGAGSADASADELKVN